MSPNNRRSDSMPGLESAAARRAFLKFTGGCAALSSTSVLSQLLNLKLMGSVYADGLQESASEDSPENSEGPSSPPGSDYKAIVCVFLNGGIDSFNVLMPYDQAEYDIYNTVRATIARPRANLLPISINMPSSGTRQLGINDAMPELQSLYTQGKAAFIANIGSLVQPTTKTTYNNLTARRPLGLFSHADLIQHWQTAAPHSRSQASGWGGRMADILNSTSNSASTVSMNIALGSVNVFQTGAQVLPYVVSSTGPTLPTGYSSNLNTGNNYDRIHNSVLNGTTGLNGIYPPADSALGSLYSDLLQRSLARVKRGSIDVAQQFFDATDNTSDTMVHPTAGPLDPLIQAPFTAIANDLTIPSGVRGFAANMAMVARVIRARTAFSQTRQIFFVSLGGWDHHDNLLTQQASMLPGLSKALSAFYNATEVLGVADKVTTFTASDFGRTLAPNSTGSDHAWGGNQIMMGGAVAGGKVYGQYPTTLALNNSLDLGRGRLVPTTSVDSYAAELATWFGIPNTSALQDILPNIREFYAEGTATRPIGFLPPS